MSITKRPWIVEKGTTAGEYEKTLRTGIAIVKSRSKNFEYTVHVKEIEFRIYTGTYTIDINQAGLEHLIWKACKNKNKRSKLGPITINAKVTETAGERRLSRTDVDPKKIDWTTKL